MDDFTDNYIELCKAIIEQALEDYNISNFTDRKILRSQFDRGLVRNICDAVDGYSLFIEHLEQLDKEREQYEIQIQRDRLAKNERSRHERATAKRKYFLFDGKG